MVEQSLPVRQHILAELGVQRDEGGAVVGVVDVEVVGQAPHHYQVQIVVYSMVDLSPRTHFITN